MASDAGNPLVVSPTAGDDDRQPRVPQRARLDRRTAAGRGRATRRPWTTEDGQAFAALEVELVRARPRPARAARVRQSLAWLLFGTFGLTSLLAGTKSDPRTGELIASHLVVPLYVLAICTLVWAMLEAWSDPRQRRTALARAGSDNDRRRIASHILTNHQPRDGGVIARSTTTVGPDLSGREEHG